MGRSLKMLVGLLAMLALLAAACSSDGDGDGDVSAEGTEDATEEPTEEATDEATPEATEEATSDATEEPTEEATPEALPASFRGVTEDTIKVGVVVPDFDALQAAGIQNYQGDAEIAFQAFFDKINAEGGVYGRQLEPVYASFDFLSPETQEVACTKLTEDDEVFIVFYGLLSQNNLCLTDLHDTMVMTRSFQNAGLREESGDTLWLQLNAADDARVTIMAEVLNESGRLDGKTIGILSGSTTGEGNDGVVLSSTLEDLGFEPQLVLLPESGSDSVARDNEVSIAAQSFLANGVDFVFDLTGGGYAPEVMARDGFEPELAFKALKAGVDGSTDRELLDGAISVAETNEEVMWEDPEFWENCMNVVLDANPDLAPEFEYLPTGDQQGEGEPNWLNPVMIACDQTMLFKLIGEIAGAELTNDSFRGALDEVGTVQLHGYGQGSVGSESKWDVLDEFYIQIYDFATDAIVIEGDPIILDRS